MNIREAWAVATQQAAAHSVLLVGPVRGLVANLVQAILGEWEFEHEELCRLRDLRVRLAIAVGNGTTISAAYAELADLERFYAERRAAEGVVAS